MCFFHYFEILTRLKKVIKYSYYILWTRRKRWKISETHDECWGGVLILDIFLATALIAGNASCKQPSDNSGYEIDDDTQNPQGGQQQGGNQQVGNQQGGETPTYRTGECQGETLDQGEFGGAQFIGKGEDWTYTYVNENQEFDKHYTNAQYFMNQKVNELQKVLNNKDTTIPLYKIIDAALKKCTTTPNIANDIANNYLALAPVFADIDNEFVKSNNDVGFNCFYASYHKLAHDAYNKSMGVWRGTKNPTNDEMDNSPENFFVDELTYAELSYDELTVNKAKEVMNDALTEVAQRTNTDTAVLKKVIELALDNESLYGLHDFAKINDINITNALSNRSLRAFQSRIEDAYQINTQSMDDRTM